MDAKLGEIVRELAESEPMKEEEYDGRMEEWCFYCGVYNENGKYKHDKSCLWARANKLTKEKDMNTVHLNGADAEKIAELMGGTLIMVNESDDTAMIAGGDPSKLVI